MKDEALIRTISGLKAVFIFGGDIILADDPAHLGLGWRSLSGLEKDKTGAMPSYERVQAAAALLRVNPALILIPSGGASNVPGQASGPAISSVMKAELVALGVPEAQIIEEPQSFVTRDHFTYCPQIAKAHGWQAHEVGILSMYFHFGRITGGISALGKEAEPFVLGQTALLSAERILAADDPSWNERFAALYASPEMTQTLMGEALGTGQLWTGHSPKYPNPFKGFNDPLDK